MGSNVIGKDSSDDCLPFPSIIIIIIIFFVHGDDELCIRSLSLPSSYESGNMGCQKRKRRKKNRSGNMHLTLRIENAMACFNSYGSEVACCKRLSGFLFIFSIFCALFIPLPCTHLLRGGLGYWCAKQKSATHILFYIPVSMEYPVNRGKKNGQNLFKGTNGTLAMNLDNSKTIQDISLLHVYLVDPTKSI